jgi:hypothetical protein
VVQTAELRQRVATRTVQASQALARARRAARCLSAEAWASAVAVRVQPLACTLTACLLPRSPRVWHAWQGGGGAAPGGPGAAASGGDGGGAGAGGSGDAAAAEEEYVRLREKVRCRPAPRCLPDAALLAVSACATRDQTAGRGLRPTVRGCSCHLSASCPLLSMAVLPPRLGWGLRLLWQSRSSPGAASLRAAGSVERRRLPLTRPEHAHFFSAMCTCEQYDKQKVELRESRVMLLEAREALAAQAAAAAAGSGSAVVSAPPPPPPPINGVAAAAAAPSAALPEPPLGEPD